MAIEKREFDGGMNGDINQRMLPINQTLNVMNARMAVSKYGRTARIENVPGTTLVSQAVRPPYGTDQTIGTAQDLDNSRILYFNYNTFGDHGIYCYDLLTSTIYAVLYDSQVTGGLNFNKNTLIHSARVENGCLYWVNGTTNEPMRIDINAAIEMNRSGTFPTVTPYQYPMSKSVLYWIRKQPALPLTWAKQNYGSYVNNFIKNEAMQFAWRFIYRNYETSTLSAWSKTANYNNSTETYNRIEITFPTGETIEQDVIQVDLVVKFLSSNKSFVINSWNKAVANDAASIAAHNTGTPLVYDFYNDVAGIALDDVYAAKPFDNLPIYAQTIEIARNRAFMGNYVAGYNTPTQTSLIAAAQNQTDATMVGQWVIIRYGGGATHYFLDCGASGFFDVSPQPSPPPYPSTFAYGSMTLVASGPASFAIYVSSHYSGWTNGIEYAGFSATITGAPPVPGIAGKACFKSGSSYQVSIEFLDHAGRKCGILPSSVKVNVADRTYGQVQYTTGINWSLSNTNALTEIPSWAYYYSINVTKSLTTTYFLQARGKNITYATKGTDGVYSFNTSSYAATQNGIAIDITSLNAFGMGYVFSEGDLVKIYLNGGLTVYNLSIIGQSGNWIICELANIGSIGNTGSPKTDFLFEIYTPYKPSASEPQYEVAQIFKINNPTTNSRSFSTLAGTITGDVTLLTRNDGSSDYLTENMSPNDKFFENWFTDAGRENFIDTIGQVTKTNTIAYSNTFIQGSKVNGLSTFDPLDTRDVPAETGDISKLQNANKIGNEQGTIMLCICKHDIVSMYLGETQVVGSSSNAFVEKSSDVVGTMNTLKGSFGTTRPESVFSYNGLVFGIDLFRGSYWQYASNGSESVSRYGMTRFFKRYSEQYLAASTSNLDAINGFHHIRSMVNPFTKEILVTLPALIYSNYANTLPSYSVVPSYATSIIDRFDIFDRLGKTMSFMYEENKWGQNYEWLPEWSEYIENTLFLFKNGNLYTADSDTQNYNTVFGVHYPMRICGVANINPSLLKDLANISIEGNAIPDFSVAMANIPNTQITDLTALDYVNQQGNYDATWLRDRLSPNASGTADQKLYSGDPLTDVAIFWMLEFQAYSNLTWINFVNIGWDASRGQEAIAFPINK